MNYTDWDDYVNGFGNKAEEFWIGLDKIHSLTEKDKKNQLKVEMVSSSGVTYVNFYEKFHVGDPDSNYRMTVGRKVFGNATESLR